MDIKAYIGPIRKWLWLIIAATLLAGVSSFIAVRQQPKTYESQTTLMVGRGINDLNPTNSEFYLSSELAGLYADMVQRELVRTKTMEALGFEDWLPEYYASVVPRTQLLELKVIDIDPVRAQLVAAELANQLINLSPASDEQLSGANRTQFVNQQLDDLQRQIEATTDEITVLESELGDLFSAREISDTQNQIQVLQNKLETLRYNYATLLSSTQEGASNALTVIELASLGREIGPESLQTVLAAMAIGMSLAVGAAYILEFLDDTIKSTEDVEDLTNVPNLTGLTYTKIEEPTEYLATLNHPRSPLSESFRELRTAIQFSNVDHPNRILLVTSANPGEGKSFTAANLAVVLAQAGHSVLLIDGDLRRPQQHLIFGMDSQRGLTSLLLESDLNQTKFEAEILDEFIQKAPEFWLGVMTCGPIPPNPSELLGSAKMKKLLATLSVMYDYLIIDSSPVMPVTDAAVLSTQVDGVVLVTAVGMTRRNQLRHMVERLKGYRANILGTVVNKISVGRGSYQYRYGHGYYGPSVEEVDAKQAKQKVKVRKGGDNGKRNGRANGS